MSEFYYAIREDYIICIFFFQAEDGIRDLTVTGVQTCALPISSLNATAPCAGPGPAAPAQAPRKIARTASLHTDRETVGEDLGEPARADASLRLGHVVRGTIEGGGPRDRIQHGVGGARIAVARLADAARIDQALRAQRVRRPRLRTQLAQAGALRLEER